MASLTRLLPSLEVPAHVRALAPPCLAHARRPAGSKTAPVATRAAALCTFSKFQWMSSPWRRPGAAGACALSHSKTGCCPWPLTSTFAIMVKVVCRGEG